MRAKLLKWMAIFVILVVVLSRAAAADIGIVFSEVLYDSDDIGDTKGEWLEIYNSTSAAVNIGGWTIKDNVDTFTIPSCTNIGAGGYLVIAEDKTYFNNKYGFDPHIANSTLRLDNDDDYLVLKDKQGNIKDQVAWEKGGTRIPGWSSNSLPNAGTGKSIVRTYLTLDTDTYRDWSNNQTPSPSNNSLPPSVPTISLNPVNLNFNVAVGGTAPAQTFSISNSGCSTLNWTVSENAGWLSCTPNSGTGSGTVTVSVNAGSLTVGVYNTAITISAANASNTPQTVPVKLTVSAAAPVIVVNPLSLSFNVEYNGATQSKTFFII
ncbi:MAG TPA: lamin tail domain-containing protein, partial [Candidatus Deferrimicrobium sp.]|nr:lamin tail domain-containing protein [Candidatus Deferrimicrobium sp.]